MQLIIEFPIITSQVLPGNWKFSSHHSSIEAWARNLYLHKQSWHLRKFWLCRKHLLIVNNDDQLDPNGLRCQLCFLALQTFACGTKSLNLTIICWKALAFRSNSVNSIKFWFFYIDIQTVLDITFDFWFTLL